MMSSLYIGATGLIALGEGMGTISNNLSNLNTVGYKERLHLFEDLMSTALTTPSNAIGRGDVLPTSYSQMGHGSATSAIITRFYENGAFEAGSQVTDLAINGKGFFQVSNENGAYYTRAGNFNFNKDGWLVNPSGLNLMGRRISSAVGGTLEAIRLDPNTEMYMPGKATTRATVISNLGMTEAKTTNAANPFFSLALSYNAAGDPPMGASGYSNSTIIYDSQGQQHELNINYDLVEHNGDGRKIIQYTVSIPASEDGRAGFAGTVGAGLLLSGTMTFTSDGELQNMSAFVPGSGANIHDLTTWNSVPVGASGVSLNTVFKNSNASGTTNAAQTFNLDFGLGFESAAGSVQAAAIGSDPNNLSGYTGAGNTAPAKGNRERTQAYSGEVSTLNRSSDGYAEGWMQRISIDASGVLSVHYDNGQHQDKFQIPLFTFQGEQDLKAEGDNLYSATLESGAAIEGVADTANLGSIVSTSLEMSNVDIARQFTYMITNQRGFQFNSKIITTTDTMLQKALELKRA
ncbi:MAG: flagellar hook-basal body complex protein [Desulfovibrionaceae bacterium]|nr:flagellar hook-basal body complex protein [Desulfovibrionaceae bacterium]